MLLVVLVTFVVLLYRRIEYTGIKLNSSKLSHFENQNLSSQKYDLKIDFL